MPSTQPNLHERAYLYRGRHVYLSEVEDRILRALAQTPGQVLSRNQLWGAAWPPGTLYIPATPNALDQQLWGLRRKLPDLIISVRAQGWYCNAPMTKVP